MGKKIPPRQQESQGFQSKQWQKTAMMLSKSFESCVACAYQGWKDAELSIFQDSEKFLTCQQRSVLLAIEIKDIKIKIGYNFNCNDPRAFLPFPPPLFFPLISFLLASTLFISVNHSYFCTQQTQACCVQITTCLKCQLSFQCLIVGPQSAEFRDLSTFPIYQRQEHSQNTFKIIKSSYPL